MLKNVLRNAQQYLDDSRVQLAIEYHNIHQLNVMDMNTFVKVTKFGIEEGFDKLFDPKNNLQQVREDLKQRLEWDYYLMIEELCGLYGAYTLLKCYNTTSTNNFFNFFNF